MFPAVQAVRILVHTQKDRGPQPKGLTGSGLIAVSYTHLIESDSKLLSGRDVAISCMLGAEEFGFGTTLLMAEGLSLIHIYRVLKSYFFCAKTRRTMRFLSYCSKSARVLNSRK